VLLGEVVSNHPQEVSVEWKVTKKICLGQGGKFEGEPCKHYDREGGECTLLKDYGAVAPVYDHGRCLSKKEVAQRIEYIVHEEFEQYADEYIPTGDFLYGSYEDGEKKTKGFLDAEVKARTLPSLYSYLDKKLYYYVLEVLRRRERIAGKHKCGKCKYWPSSGRRECQLQEIECEPNPFWGTVRKYSDPVCEGYVQLRTFLKPVDEQGRLMDEKRSRPTSNPMKLQAPESLEAAIAERDVHQIEELMRACIDNAETDKQIEIQIRRLEDLQFRYRRFLEDASIEEANKKLVKARKIGTEDEETVAARIEWDRQKIESCLSGEARCT
jgi:hypothetical protein